MVIDNKAKISGKTNHFTMLSLNGMTVYLNGLFYLDGYHIGVESLKVFIEKYYSDDYIEFDKMRGSFTMIVIKDDKVTAFSDNSNMHCLYYSDKYISDSCIELVKRMKEDGERLTLNDSAVYQQFSYGKIFGERTYVSEILPTNYLQYFDITEGKILRKEKKIGDISARSGQDSIYDFLKSFAHSVEKEKVSCAVTGGYDSRMIFAVLNNEIKVDCSISGNNKKDANIRISKEVAKAGKAPWTSVEAEKPELTADYLRKQFFDSDGMEMYINNNRFRWVQYVDFLKNNGYTVCISGDGGVLHKDWEWKQDAPFYNRKRVNIRRYYDQRIACQQSMYDAGKKLAELLPSQKRWFFEEMEKYKKETNTQSYDMFYNYLNGNRCFEYNLCDGKHLFYAPLQELDAVRYSYHLPRRKRTFYNLDREVTTKANEEIARIPTNYGTNASNLKRDKIADIWREGKSTLFRAYKIIYRKITKRTIGVQKASTWDCLEDIRRCSLTLEAVSWAISMEYLQKGTDAKKLTERKLGAILYAYLWTQLIQ